MGDGHILCNNSGGNISVGDGICSSASAGIGQKATVNPTIIIGIAQEDLTFANDTETKLVAVQYGLHSLSVNSDITSNTRELNEREHEPISTTLAGIAGSKICGVY